MRSRVIVLVIMLAVCMTLTAPPPASALDLGSALKLFGIGYAVKVFGGQINSFINTLLAHNGVAWEGTTKVVPIISIGSGAHVGAAQVAGPPELVKKVQAVAQGELHIGDFRGTALIPISTSKATGGLKRVEGVGLSALIDFKI